MKKNNSSLIFIVIIVVFIAASLFGLNYLSTKRENQGKEALNQNIDIDEKTFQEEGRDHTENKVTYKTFPPTSGDHSEHPAKYGFYEKPVPYENLVHSLEHGDIVVYYNPSLTKKELDTLKEISKITYEGSGVQVVPNSEIKKPVVLTAWTKMLELESVDAKQIKQFIYEYIYEGPEKLPPNHGHS